MGGDGGCGVKGKEGIRRGMRGPERGGRRREVGRSADGCTGGTVDTIGEGLRKPRSQARQGGLGLLCR